MLPSCGRPGAATMAPGSSAFLGVPSALAPLQRRPCPPLGRRLTTRAILEKVREAVAPSNGVPIDWKPKSDPASIQADVLQNLGTPHTYSQQHGCNFGLSDCNTSHAATV